MEALHYKKLENQSVQCGLCPHNCVIDNEKLGNCRVRRNNDGILFAENYARLSAINSDPIEKKPLYHFYPGSKILSVGSCGCNLHCRFCQNSDISQSPANKSDMIEISAELLVEKALIIPSNIGIAYTYNEPTVFYEYMFDTALLARKAGLKNVVVSNGFINIKPLDKLIDIIDCFNIDLKSFSEDFYRKITGGKRSVVLDNLKNIRRKNLHLEITHLVVNGLNDQLSEFQEMVNWISSELGAETVFHISRYFPRYKQSSPPTPDSKLIEFYEVAKQKLSYTYLGNVNLPIGNDTNCSSCGKKVIHRQGYSINIDGLDGKGACKNCGHSIVIQ